MFKLFLLVLTSSLLLTACQKKSAEGTENYIQWNGQEVDRRLISDGVEFRVVSKNLLYSDAAITSQESQNTALVLGFPRQLLGQQNVFGGVVTEASDYQDVNIGGLKLSDITPVHVQTVLSADETKLNLEGCQANCDETSKVEVLFQIPVVKTDDQFVYLDLTAFGSGLDFLKEMTSADPTPITATATKVARFDFTLSTLVFDVENTYANFTDATKSFTLTTRWYLKLSSGFNPNFTSRLLKPEAGFFTTLRNKTTLITRFAGSGSNKALVKYYIKDVPQEWRAAFADSFEDWNKKLGPALGKDLLEYEFLETTDPRYSQIITGDARYNVLEWDLKNKASYGGLGPSIANQMTGETFSANVLIQGPTVIDLYTKWWKVATTAQALEAQGQKAKADRLKVNFFKLVNARLKDKMDSSKLSLGKLQFNIHAADPRVADKALDASEFLELAPGYTYETYMYGYFRDMVAHELGHNIGLRHNFRGNLGASDSNEIGSVSRSIMEYLGRLHRHLDRVGAYDVMAISYGYKGLEPAHKNWFCTDDDQVDEENITHSAECSNSDATHDPFTFLIERLHKAKEFLFLPGSEQAPVWTVTVLKPQVAPLLTNLANYYVSSFATAQQWTNFITGQRNMPVAQIPDFILQTLQKEVCDKHLDELVAQKTTAAQPVAAKNLKEFRDLFKEITKDYTKPVAGFTEANFPCLK